jgi:hypothetical protein
MTQRITDAHLEAKVRVVNGMLGNDPDAPYPTPGMVILYSAYGSTAVHRVCNEHGGQENLSTLGTKREAALFLSGMIAALRALQGR